MKVGPDISRIAALIGDPARTNMLMALLSGESWSAGDLAREAGVTPATASSHLAKLQAGGLVHLSRQGRYRFYALADGDVGDALEALLRVAVRAGHTRHVTAPSEAPLRFARVCYDHLAGARGVRLFGFLKVSGHVAERERGLLLTDSGRAFLSSFGIGVTQLERMRRPLCRPCLDWSEQTYHLGGLVGAAMLERMSDLGWLERMEGSRALEFTDVGDREFAKLVGEIA